MGEDMADIARQFAPGDALGQKRDTGIKPAQGKAGHAAQQSTRRPDFNQHRATHLRQKIGLTLALGPHGFGRAARIGAGVGRGGAAMLLHGADQAARLARRAKGRAQIHHRLRIIAGPLPGRQGIGFGADLRFGGGQRRINRIKPRHHPLDIAIDHDGALVKSNRGEGGGGVGANAGKRAPALLVLREDAVQIMSDINSGLMQPAGAGVIAKPGPGAHDILPLRIGERLHIGPARQKGLKIRDDSRHQCLLQHDLRKQNLVGPGGGTGRGAPGQGPVGLIIPGQKVGRKARWIRLGAGHVCAIGKDIISVEAGVTPMQTRPARRASAVPLGQLIGASLDPLLAKRGFTESGLIMNWQAIVGDRLAKVCTPEKMLYPPRGPKTAPDAKSQPATLVLRVESAMALELQHLAPVIVARINGHFGWAAVAKLSLRQGPVATKMLKKPPRPQPDAAMQAKARAISAGIEDETLREHLATLGALVLREQG